jgi:hypothetical protein
METFLLRIFEIGPCKNYGSQAGLGPTRGPRVFSPGLTTWGPPVGLGRSLTGPKIDSQKNHIFMFKIHQLLDSDGSCRPFLRASR